MDNNHYSSSVINTSSAASYPSPSTISPTSHLQNGQNGQSLPSLHHNPAMSMYASHPHTPRTPATPNTPNSMGSYAPPPPQQAAPRPSYPMMHNPYQQPQQSYATSSAMMPQASVASAHPQPIAPAPSPGGRVPPVLRPMPAGGVMPQSGLASPYAQSPMMGQPSLLQESDQPTHVVGSQGRRGILPSAPGRPAPPAPGSAAAKAQIPQKDADGKFPCPHCTKTYLHAKHLKRHMLRHTGDRPYMCVLCRDTFSRSDILKRHFQKCSIRRGNPTGVSHLSHPAAHVKKSQAAAAKAAHLPHGHEGDMGMNGMSMGVPFGLIPAADQMNHHMSSNPNDHQAQQLSRSSSHSEDRRSVPAPLNPSAQQHYSSVPTSMAQQMTPQLANYSMSQNQNGVPMFNGGSNGQQQQSSLDWQAMFSQGQQGGAQPTQAPYAQPTYPPNNTFMQTASRNFENPRQDSLPSGEFANTRYLFSTRGPPTNQITYQSLSDKIIQIFNPPDVAKLFFSPDNIRHFLERYSHFDRHFQVLHIPTFDIASAYSGLLAVMCCIGACYSDRVASSFIRDVVSYLTTSLGTEPRMLQVIRGDAAATGSLDELQALVLLHVLLVWNGDPSSRVSSRRIYSYIARGARDKDLLRVHPPSSPLFSPLHQADFSMSTYNSSKFDWKTFIEQEKRVRLMQFIWAIDVSGGLYFNYEKAFDYRELQIPLPCDEAAFDATDPRSCSEALGLYGHLVAKNINPEHTRPSQPWLAPAVDALLSSSYKIQNGATTLSGKFLILHTLLALIRRAYVEGDSSITSNSFTLSHYDWIEGAGEEGMNGNAHSRGTQSNGNIHPQTFEAIRCALEKAKENWDQDYATQFSASAPNSARRHGFSKDGVHFYWLAQYLLNNGHYDDFKLPAEHRFVHVVHLLKSVKAWVKTDGASRGEEMGSVGDIDKNFGLTNLTLDMANIFRPMPRVVEMTKSIGLSPVANGTIDVRVKVDRDRAA